MAGNPPPALTEGLATRAVYRRGTAAARKDRTRMTSFSAVILAGGRSRRFGSPKAEATFHGQPLLARVVEAVTSVASEIVVVCAPGQQLRAPAASVPIRRVDDETPYLGPMAGLLTGLRTVAGEWVFVVGCDMPLLTGSILGRLADARDSVEAVVPRIDGRLQPLAALYRRDSALAALEIAWSNGERSLMDALRGLRVTELTPDSLGLDEAGLLAFRPVNTPGELADLERRAGGAGAGAIG